MTLISKRWNIELPRHRHIALDWDVWEKERLDALHRNIKKGDLLIDVGAEQGDLTCLFALWGANVVPIEPNPLFWPTIRQIFHMNGIDRPENYFAGFASNEMVTPTDLLEDPFGLPAHDGWPGCAFMDIKQTNDFRNVLERRHDTPQTMLDGFVFDDKNIAIINIDVEGAEWEVLKGATWLLSNKKPLVFVSVHPEFMENDYSYTKEDFLFWMDSLGYEAELLAIDHEHHYVFWHPEGKPYL